ncbi:MAG: serine/threonine-protein kinase [Planctomycetes bacterium]|nr:serine/threonine-protein kinase [Planctomycetota bacterium]
MTDAVNNPRSPDQMASRIGPYEITREIGRGGMGVVYLARDTKLDRNVAIKTLPDELAQDEERMQRFEREAKLLASLNHPNIATVHGLEEVDGKRYLILEYVEGETLEDKLSRGAIPVDEALPIAKQIAEAIEAAHAKGIIHRDLKPANIKFTASGNEQVKVLDFGLAKALVDETSTASELAHSPTIIAGGSPTLAGVVLGTAGYLSPEQARGRSVDKRTDIFSFGCVLYEMLTGERLFTGETVSDILASTLKVEPVWADLPPDTPPTIHLLLRRCLAKDHKRRLQDIGSARVEIVEAIADPSGSSLSLAVGALREADARAGISPKRMAGVVGVLITLVILLTVVVMLRISKAPEPTTEHYSIIIPHRPSDFASFLPTLAISSDGSTIAFAGRNKDGENQIYLRRRDSTEAIPVSGTLGGEQPRFSPDGKWLTYGTGSSFCKTSVLGGPTTIISEEPRTPGHTWLNDDQIVYCTYDDGKSWIVPAVGGIPKQFVPDEIQPEHAVLSWPETLPGGNAVLFDMHYQGSNEQRSIVVYDLTTGRLKTLVEQGAYPRYAKSGHLLYVHETTLMAAPFDVSTLELTGPSTPFRSDFKMTSFAGASDYAIADDGTLISLANKDVPSLMPTRIDLKGVSQPATSHKQPFNWIRLAPDGMKAAVIISEGSVFETSLWLLDFERDLLTLLTPEQGNQYYPIFSPDSQWLYYTQWISGRVVYDGLYRRRVDGSGGPEKLAIDTTWTLDENRIVLDNFSSDGRTLYLSISSTPLTGGSTPAMDIFTLTLDDDLKLEPLIATPASEHFAAPSPDGQWLAYTSNESGIPQVYIRPIDGRGARVQVSRDGGVNPIWSQDGSTIYFLTASRMIRAARISVNDESDSASVLRVGEISDLFIHTSPHRNFDLYPDGEHFLMLTSGINEGEERTEIRITLNFFEELKRLAPTGKN